MRELDNNGKPIKASTYNWRAKGFDGFLGYGYDKETGECCEDCICDDNCEEVLPATFYILYAWEAPCKDLDTKTTFLDFEVGWSCRNNQGDLMRWTSGDQTTAGGFEAIQVNFDLEENPEEEYTIETHAHWYEPAWDESCNGNFSIYVTAEPELPDAENPAFLEEDFNTQVKFAGCSQNFIRKIIFSKKEIKWG